MYRVRPRSLLTIAAALLATRLAIASTDIPGIIQTTQTWTASGNPYRLWCNAQVMAGVKVTLGSGVVVQASGSYQLTVSGGLDCQGTASAPVVFRAETTPAAGSWLGISLQPGSSSTWACTTVTDATTGVSCDGARLVMGSGCSISGCRDDGLLVAGAAMTDLRGVTFSGNGRDGVHATPTSASGAFSGCTLSANGRYPVFANAAAAGLLGSGNAYTANGAQMIGVACNSANDVSTAVAWTAQGVAYHLDARPTSSILFVASGGTLTLAEGVTVVAGGILVQNGGRLTANGTALHPCTFTSSAASPLPGDWPGIALDPGAQATLQNCVIRYAVRGVTANSCSPVLRNCRITDCKLDGVMYSGSAAGTIGGCLIGSNGQDGVSLYATAAPNLGQVGVAGTGGNVFRRNGRHAVHSQSSRSITAQDNYWGTASPAQVSALVYDHADLAAAGTVTCTPLEAGTVGVAGLEGTAGWGASRFVSGNDPLYYTIYFENDSAIGGPTVHDVVVTANLPAELDWTSVAFAGASHPANLMFSVDPFSGAMSAAFVGIELPPNPSPGSRQGWLTFTAMPGPGMATRAQVSTQAQVSFDYDDPIVTNTWSNLIDSGAPTSKVNALPAVEASAAFPVSWGGTDDAGGVGIATYAVYVSDNGKDFVAWQAGTAATSGTYTGIVGHAYGFYCVATDLVGNAESPPSSAQATTTVANLSTTFPAGLSMVAIPAATSVADPHEFGFSADAWFRWDPATKTYVSYADDPTHFTWLSPGTSVPGRGFWTRFGAQTVVKVTGATVPVDRPYTIHLDPGAAPGWVQIGCPFPADALWRLNDTSVLKVVRGGEEKSLADAAAAGWLGSFAWGRGASGYELVYDQTAAPVGDKDRLEAWHGYWVWVAVPCDLVLTPAVTPAALARPKVAAERGGWQLRLVAHAGSTATGASVLGQVSDSAKPLAADAPPDVPGFVQVASVDGYRRLAVDLRSGAGPQKRVVTVATDIPSAQVSLSWPDLSSLPRGVRPVLVDEETGRRIYLRTSNAYAYTSPEGGGIRRFTLELLEPGTEVLACTAVAAAATPTGGAELSFVLSADADVTARILNIAGLPVRSLCQDRLCPAGVNRLSWDGRSDRGTPTPSGAYLVEVRARTGTGQEARGLSTVRIAGR